MRIIPRYILRGFLPVFTIAMLGFIGIYLVVDFFEKIDSMLEKSLALNDIILYFVCKIPFVATQGIPMAAIISSIISLGILKRNRELIAMETAGVHPFRFVAPIAVAGLLLSILSLCLSEGAVRPLNQKIDDIWEVKVKQKKPSLWMNPENLWYRDEHTMFQVRLYEREKNVMHKATIFFLDSDFRLARRVDARRITWADPVWVAEEGLVVSFRDGLTDQRLFDRMDLELNVRPSDLAAGETVPDNLGWMDLYRYTRKIESEGLDSSRYRTELSMRIAHPFATFIMAMLGVVIALRQGLHGGIAAGVGISLAVAFSFLALANLGASLASAGVLPPTLGVWSGNIIFSSLALYFWMRGYS